MSKTGFLGAGLVPGAKLSLDCRSARDQTGPLSPKVIFLKAHWHEIARGGMFEEGLIDELIETGGRLMESHFDPVAFQTWKTRASDYLSGLVGPEHTYAKYFQQYVRKPEEGHVLTGRGILLAARESRRREVCTTTK